MTTTTPVKEELPKDLLSASPADLADLYRRDSRFAVAVIFLPELAKPESAHATFYDEEGNVISVEENLSVTDGYLAFKHPARFSKKLADHLSRRDKKQPA